MSMELIGVGFTTDTAKKATLSVIANYIRAIPDETLESEEFRAVADTAGYWDEYVDADTVRETIISGATEYHSALQGHNSAHWTLIPGTTLRYTFVGGGSWGDDPFDGFTDLCIFLDALPVLGLPVEDVGLVCGGLPDPTTALRYAKGEIA